ncbi:MAG: hypothetical protein LBL78_00415 [Prevotellaceae bacterium]|nr:hypothetical protein [Prevotellaceae bacterium]
MTATADNPAARTRSSYGLEEDENGNTYFVLDWNQDPSTEHLTVLGANGEGFLKNLGTVAGIRKEAGQMTFSGEVAESDYYHFYYPSIADSSTHIKEHYNAESGMLERVTFDLSKQICYVNDLYSQLPLYDVMYAPLAARADNSNHVTTRLKRVCTPISMKFLLPQGIKEVTKVIVSYTDNQLAYYSQLALAYNPDGSMELLHENPVSAYYLQVVGDKDDLSERQLMVTLVMPSKNYHPTDTRAYRSAAPVVTLVTANGESFSSSAACDSERMSANVALSRR